KADRDTRQAELDKQSNTLDLLNANLNSLQGVISEQGVVSANLTTLMAQLNTAKTQLRNQAPDITATLASLLESQEQDLILRSYQTAWSQAQVGTGLALVNKQLPGGKTIAGRALSLPMRT